LEWPINATTEAALGVPRLADLRVYHHYDALDVLDGNIAYFDFDAAERNDPRNAGRYLVDGGKLIIHMPGQQSINTDAPTNGILTIYGVDYRRQEVLRLPRPAGLPAISFGGFDWRRQRKKLLSQLTVSERPPRDGLSV